MRNKSSRHISDLIRIKRILNLLLAISLSLTPASAWQQRQRTTSQWPATGAQQPTPPPAAPTPQSSPLAAPVAASSKSSNTVRSLSELQSRIENILARPDLAQALVAVKVSSLDTGRVLFEENAVKLLRPASNMKVFTVAAALDRLSPEYRYSTSVYAPARPDAAGVIHGDLTIYGRGDPSFAARFNNGDYLKGIDELANRIVSAGVKRIEGDLVGDESYFVGPQYGSGWEWEDLTWYYGAEISALTVNDNALDLFVKPGVEPGTKAVITTGPPDPLLTIVNQVTTGVKGSKRDLTIHRELGKDALTVSGSIALDDRGFTAGVGISHPALLFVYLLRASLAQRGVSVTGKSRTIGAANQTLLTPGTTVISLGDGATSVPAQTRGTEITNLLSPPLSVIAAHTLKPSQNLYTELILRTLGRSVSLTTTLPNSVRTSEDAGLEVIKSFLKSAGIQPESLVLNDGSGLSRNDMITADATVQLLTHMSRHPHAAVFRDALPVAGVDGTLKNRLKGTPAENNLRAKTGSLSSAASLAGYVTTVAGEKLVFAIIVNNYPSDVEPRTACIDPIAVLLASLAAKSE